MFVNSFYNKVFHNFKSFPQVLYLDVVKVFIVYYNEDATVDCARTEVNLMKLQAKLIEKDKDKRHALVKAFQYYGVSFVICEDQIEVNFTGHQHQAYIFAELIKICEDCRCTSFQITH